MQLEKSPDGIGGGWKLGGVKLAVNGRVVYANDHIERWLENGHRTWRAPNFHPSSPTGRALPIWIDLREDDSLYGGDDQGDINRYDARDAIARGYAPGPPLEEQVTGEHVLGGRLGKGGDKASLRYRLDTLVPILSTPPPPPPPPPPPSEKPDLVITELTANSFTVKNQGNAAAGKFTVTVKDFNSYDIAGLAPGESATRTFASGCSGGHYEADADSLNEVAESDETNNVATADIIC